MSQSETHFVIVQCLLKLLFKSCLLILQTINSCTLVFDLQLEVSLDIVKVILLKLNLFLKFQILDKESFL